MELKKLSAHKCPIKKFNSLNNNKLHIPDVIFECSGCGDIHMVNKSFHSLKYYKNVLLCSSCLKSTYIHDIQQTWSSIYLYISFGNDGVCNFCDKLLFAWYKGTLCKVFDYEMDHKNLFSKSYNIWELVTTGAPINIILSEVDKCQLLCIRCHSIKTFSERYLG